MIVPAGLPADLPAGRQALLLEVLLNNSLRGQFPNSCTPSFHPDPAPWGMT